jgi:hypothetical protein
MRSARGTYSLFEDRTPRRFHPYGVAKQFAVATPSKDNGAFGYLDW